MFVRDQSWRASLCSGPTGRAGKSGWGFLCQVQRQVRCWIHALCTCPVMLDGTVPGCNQPALPFQIQPSHNPIAHIFSGLMTDQEYWQRVALAEGPSHIQMDTSSEVVLNLLGSTKDVRVGSQVPAGVKWQQSGRVEGTCLAGGSRILHHSRCRSL